jgi:hypothetical protein
MVEMLWLVRGLLATVTVVTGLCPATALAAPGTGQISGRITASDGTPITSYGVCAYAYSYDVDAYPNTTTLVAARAADQTGSYVLPRLPAATYIVAFADCHPAPGADAPQYAPGVTDTGSAHQYVLAAGGTITRVDAQLRTGTSISGRITAATDGHPLGGICVDATTFGVVSGPLAPVHARTAADGSYRLGHLPVIAPQGSYSLSFTDCNSPRVYLAQPVSGPVSPTVAQPSTGIDAQLQVGASITGRLTDAHGRPVAPRDICASAQPSDYLHRGPPNTYDTTRTDGSGRYRLGGLVGDSYDVQFQDCTTNANVLAGERNDATVIERVTVGDGQSASHDARLTPGATIRGHVYAGPGSSTPVAGACVRVTTQESVYSVHAPFLDETVRTTRDGGYALGHLAPASAPYVGGAWLVSFSHCSPPYDTTWYDGAPDSSQAKSLRPTAAQTLTGIDGHLPASKSTNRAAFLASMTAALHRLLVPVATPARGTRRIGPRLLPKTAAGTWSLRVTLAPRHGRRALLVFRGSARLRHPGHTRLTLNVTTGGRAWLRSAAAHRTRSRLHARLTFRPAGHGRAIAVSADLIARPR